MSGGESPEFECNAAGITGLGAAFTDVLDGGTPVTVSKEFETLGTGSVGGGSEEANLPFSLMTPKATSL